MAKIVRTAVLIHGCHLQANLKGKVWEEIVWGLDKESRPTLAGRALKGLEVFLRYGAELLIFSTGASERDGVKEGEYTRNWALEHAEEVLTALDHHVIGVPLFRQLLLDPERCLLDLESQNTRQECERNFRLCVERGIERIIIVSSAWHIERCHAEALKVAKAMRDAGEQVPEVVAIGDHGSTEGIVIVEPSHRGDQPLNEFSQILGSGLYRVPASELEPFQAELRALFAKYVPS